MAIYLDNAATTFPKPESVYRTIDFTFRHLGVSPGRGSYRLSLEAGHMVLEVREAVADFFGILDPLRVVFCANATEAINIALFGILKPGDRVVTSTMEHNAVSRPLHALAARGVEVVRVAADAAGWVDPAAIRDAVRGGGRADPHGGPYALFQCYRDRATHRGDRHLVPPRRDPVHGRCGTECRGGADRCRCHGDRSVGGPRA